MGYYGRKSGVLEDAATQVLEDAGFFETNSVLARRVAEGVVKLVKLFEEQDYSAICGRLVAALFARIARGVPPDAKFLKEVWAEVEKVAEVDPYSSEDEKRRWIKARYPSLCWAGNLVKHVEEMVFPVKESVSIERFHGAPLHRDGYGILPITSPLGLLLPPIFGDGYMMPRRIETVDRIEPADDNKENINKDKEKEDMDINQLVNDAVADFCDNLEPFTSLDISNAVKLKGVLVRHREVAPVVRELFAKGTMGTYGYDRELIGVKLPGGGTADAYLYHHTTVPASAYDNRAQVALLPPPPQGAIGVADPVASNSPVKDSDKITVTPVSTVTTPVAAVFTPITVAPAACGGPLRMAHQKRDGRLEVPAKWMEKLCWITGDQIKVIVEGSSIVLKRTAGPLDKPIKSLAVDRWGRIRIHTRILRKAGIDGGAGASHCVVLLGDGLRIE